MFFWHRTPPPQSLTFIAFFSNVMSINVSKIIFPNFREIILPLSRFFTYDVTLALKIVNFHRKWPIFTKFTPNDIFYQSYVYKPDWNNFYNLFSEGGGGGSITVWWYSRKPWIIFSSVFYETYDDLTFWVDIRKCPFLAKIDINLAIFRKFSP